MSKSRSKKLTVDKLRSDKTSSEILKSILADLDLLNYRDLDKLQSKVTDTLWDKFGAVTIEMEDAFLEDEIDRDKEEDDYED